MGQLSSDFNHTGVPLRSKNQPCMNYEFVRRRGKNREVMKRGTWGECKSFASMVREGVACKYSVESYHIEGNGKEDFLFVEKVPCWEPANEVPLQKVELLVQMTDGKIKLCEFQQYLDLDNLNDCNSMTSGFIEIGTRFIVDKSSISKWVYVSNLK